MRTGRTGVAVAGRGPFPAPVEVVRRRFELWRGTRSGHSRIPEGLWASAVKLAGVYGLCRIAQALRLNYAALKDHIEAVGPPDDKGLERRLRSTSLVDLPTPRARAQTLSVRGVPGPKNPQASPRIPRWPQPNPAMTFVELPPAERVGGPECLIELEHPRGAKMRIRVTGYPSPEVVTAVSQVFFRAEA